MHLPKFLEVHWEGLLALSVMNGLEVMKKGWKLHTACNITARVIERALGLVRCEKKRIVEAKQLKEAATQVRNAVKSGSQKFLFVLVALHGKRCQVSEGACVTEEVTRTNFGHNFIICVFSGRVFVFNSFIACAAAGFPGLRMSQCEPQRERPVEGIAGALDAIASVYEQAAVKTHPSPQVWEKYREALQNIVGVPIPDKLLQTELLAPYDIAVSERTSDELLGALRKFASSNLKCEKRWIHEERDGEKQTTCQFLDSALPNYRKSLVSLRAALRAIRRFD